MVESKSVVTMSSIPLMSETVLHVIRMIKMFGWEDKMRKTLDEKREEELAWLWKDKVSQTTIVCSFLPISDIDAR